MFFGSVAQMLAINLAQIEKARELQFNSSYLQITKSSADTSD